MDREEDYGLIRPNLIKQLRSILDQYPDDGQILKELIQNAEDAGAQQIKFLFDGSQHGTQRLHHPDMAQFQGPALYAYNNALFEEKDWTGIRMLQDSIKEKDPMKVGRFGLGFKSVLHVTDLPCVLSGDRIVMIDPCEKYFTFKGDKTTGYSWHLSERRAEIAAIPDQFTPFQGIFNSSSETFRQGFYPGTIFRFPLRTQPSEVSDTIYSPDRVNELFKTFEEDAHFVLLFLKNLESIELLTKVSKTAEPQLQFKVSVSPSCLEYVRQQRKSFQSRIQPGKWMQEPVTITYPLVITTVSYRAEAETKKVHKWIVNEYYAGGEASIHLQTLQRDPMLSYVPLAGTAMPLGVTEETAGKALPKATDDKAADGDNTDDLPKGQIFCFLPLPIEQKSSTGLPVHVNGYFSVSQNRRHLKWPTAGQNVKSDKSLLWNQCLLQEVVPKSYLQLILQAIILSQRNPKLVTPKDIYAAMPNLLYVDEKWKAVLQGLFSPLFQHPILHSKAQGGRWINVQRALFDFLKETPETHGLLTKMILDANMNLVSCPHHIVHAMGMFSTHSPEIVTPSTVRQAMLQQGSLYQSLSRQQKLLLLQYVIKDEDFHELMGLQLLPVADGTFVLFERRGSPVFVERDDVPATLLPGLDAQLLSNDLEETTLYKLKNLADEGTSRLHHLTPANFLRLLPKVFPRSWMEAKSPISWNPVESAIPESWFEQLWTFLRRHYPSDLSGFTGLPILPTMPETPYGLVTLSKPPTCIFKSAMGGMLTEGVSDMLLLLGAHIVIDLPTFVKSHGLVMGNYMKLPLAEDVADLLVTMHRTFPKCLEIIRNEASPQSKEEMIELLSALTPKRVNIQTTKFLRLLPLFPTNSVEGKVEYVSVNEVGKAAPKQNINVDLNQRFLDLQSDSATTLARNLGVTFVDVSTVLRNSVLPDIRQNRLKPDKVQDVMSQVFQNIHSYAREDPSLFQQLSTVPFVTIEKGNPRCPGELYDPDVSALKHIFQGEAVFPVGIYAESDNLILLRKMGLRGIISICGKDILYSAISVEQCEENPESQMNKATAILKHLSKHWAMLLEEVNGALLAEWLKGIKWVPVMREKPSIFPDKLQWNGTAYFAKPESMKSIEWAPAVGSVMPIVKGAVCLDMTQVFGWNTPPLISNVISHLCALEAAYTSEDKAKCLSLVCSIYDFFSKSDHVLIQKELQNQGLLRWVWNGDGFCSMEQVVLLRPFADLQPYVYALPSEMTPFLSFFKTSGINEMCSFGKLLSILFQIKSKHEQKQELHQVQRDLQLSIDVLNHICKMEQSDGDDVHIPCQSQDDSLNMLPVSELTYCDVEWVRQGFDLMEFDEQEDGIVFIHPNLPVATAEALGVPTLMSRMLHAEELAITGFGQTEPLTTRLHRLLEDYTDGLAIPKELIQNADDAGATVVKFLYDERTNSQSMKYLIDEGMRECQGPALWAYNNAVFTDADFENITKLGGATKEQEVDKIGKFGLGFNAVYNITDVPSFISRNNIVVFDPHTTHLGRGIRDRSKPGIKIDMKRNKTLLRKLPDQFQPYAGIFGCDVHADKDGYFDGTLFRLPLRTRSQAARSDISKLHYDQKQVLALLHMLVKNAHSLLLFTQNVICVEIYHLQDGDDPQNAVELFKVVKEPIKIVRQLRCGVKPNTKVEDEATQAMIQNSNVLKAASHYLRATAKAKKARTMAVLEIPQATSCVRTVTSISNAGNSVLSISDKSKSLSWIISSCMGQEASLSLSKSHNRQAGYVPVAAVATLIEERNGGFVPVNMLNTDVRAQVFCYLPLPVATGLPIHINASFAMQSSRRNLSEKTDDDKQNDKFDWNISLLEDAVMHAYVQMLHDSQQILPPNVEIQYFDLWPLKSHAGGYFQPFVQSFYKNLGTMMKIPVFYNGSELVSLSSAVFLDPLMSKSSTAAKCAKEMFSQYLKGLTVVCISESALNGLREAGCESIIQEKTYDVLRFYTEVFFPNVTEMDAEYRDPLVSFAILHNQPQLDDLLKSHRCIPVSPEGKQLKSPLELIHPSTLASKLFTADDERFPHGLLAEGRNLMGLQRLGMKVNEVEWIDIIERAGTVQPLMQDDPDIGKARQQQILSFIERNLLNVVSAPSRDDLEEVSEALSKVPFLLLHPKPAGFPLKWHNEDIDPDICVIAADEAFTKDMCYLVSTTQPVLSEDGLTRRIKTFLGLSNKSAKIEQVMTQMEHALAVNPNDLDAKAFEELERVCSAVYYSLQDFCQKDEDIAQQLKVVFETRECILTSQGFQEPRKVAFQFPYNCAPYLYVMPSNYTSKFRPLMHRLGVREQFEIQDYMEAMNAMHTEYKGHALKEKPLDVSIRLVTLLNNAMKVKKVAAEDVEKDFGPIYVPNADNTLQSASTLCFNDCQWISSTQTMNFTHPDITFNTAASLGVKTKRQEALSKHAQGIPFGQKERLTNSLRRILNTYPLDHEIFKELIQNADDAGASQIHFVIDPRNHSTQHVFEESWKQLQGPSLCVFNNKPFSKADLDGIQRLGEGSKNQDPSKTGQYGIGFSSVYHLTDCPSVLTHGSDMGKTLCVFDPHCRFVPGATNAEPGMQYTDIENLERAFPDVFSCFPTKFFNMEGSTMFRFPLRSRQMAEMSQISKNLITVSKVQSVLHVLKNELFDILLFTNNLQQVSISEIDSLSGELKNTYTVKAMTSHKALRERQEFQEELKKSAHLLKSGDIDLHQVPRIDLAYNIIVNDNTGHQEKWCVTQHLGLDENVEVPDSITQAVKFGDLALMPRGGAACLVERRLQGHHDSVSGPKKVFCILPLPMTTDLPVHINGHFALGYENRRGLWTDGSSYPYKKAWNDMLCMHVIAAAYTKLLEMIRMEGVPCEMEDNVSKVACSRPMLESALKTHQSVFPLFKDTETQWDVLVKGVYQYIARSHAPVLPSIRELGYVANAANAANEQSMNRNWQVMWLPPKGEGTSKAFFSTLEKTEEEKSDGSLFGKVKGWFKAAPQTPQKTDSQILKEVLLDCGFKLLEASSSVAEHFKRCGVQVDYMSPEGVILFFSSYSTDNPMCDIGELPKKLEATPFQDYKTLRIILEYCKQDPGFLYTIDGAPLLLTDDRQVRVFDAGKPVFLSKYMDLVPACGDLFVHSALLSDVFSGTPSAESLVFKEFKISDLGDLMDKILPQDDFCNQEAVEYSKAIGSTPSTKWLKRVWTFLYDQLKITVSSKDLKIEEKSEIVFSELMPLVDWCIVPTEINKKSHLVSVKHASSVLSLHRLDYEFYQLKDIFSKLQVWELDYNAINTSDSFNYDVAKLLVSSLDRPHSVLFIVWKALNANSCATDMRKDECLKLLSYFCKNLTKLKDQCHVKPKDAVKALPKTEEHADFKPDEHLFEDVSEEVSLIESKAANEVHPVDPAVQNAQYLCDLPFYATIYGDMIQLTDCLVYTLPSRIPTNGIEIWQSKSGTVFLERNDQLEDLYKFIGCANISVLFVYCKFIFQQFEYMPPEDRMVHLHHVYKEYLKNDGNSENINTEEQETLLDCLRSLEFLENSDGELCSASEFYDRENVVFSIMLTQDKFPPPAPRLFKQSEWNSFLTKIGLQTEVSTEQFLQFANDVASEGKRITGAGAIMKSKVLVQHMFKMNPSHLQDIMTNISTVKFLAAEQVSPQLSSISPQYGDILGNNQVPLICFDDSVPDDYAKIAWTTAHILPTWANPHNQQGINPAEKESSIVCLGIQKVPKIDIVMAHFQNICNLKPEESNRKVLDDVFKSVFQHLQTYECTNDEVIQKLSKTDCITVDNGTRRVRPSQTVFSLYNEDEIRPFLYKVPVHYGVYQELFRAMGATDQVTPDQYAGVLRSVQLLSGYGCLTPNELHLAFKATRGLFYSLKRGPRMSNTQSLYLPSEKGELIDSSRLVYNNAPSFYDRVKEYNLHILIDLKECGLQSSHMEEEIRMLPQSMCPAFLSTFVHETLVRSTGASSEGLAAHLNQRIKAEEFLRAVARLIRHEAHARGEKIDEMHMFDVIDRLSTIIFYSVPDVKTHLMFKNKPIPNSDEVKQCFVEKSGDMWKVYIKSSAELNQELLIPVAEVINRIVSGMLRNSVLYLLPVLSCPTGQVQAKLNSLNVRLDHSEASASVSAMPKLGDTISDTHSKLLKWGSTDFSEGEYVGFKEKSDGAFMYARIQEEVMSPEDDKVYLLNVGSGMDAVIAQGLQIYKFSR